MAAPDPTALVAAAVRAAAVVSVLMRPAEAAPSTVRGETARDPAAPEAVVAKSEEERREAARAKRRSKDRGRRL